MIRRIATGICCAALCILAGCGQTAAPAPSQPSAQPQTVRAVWVPYMETEQLIAAEDPVAAIADCMRDIADRGANTVYFHVRANSDAYYASTVYTPTDRTAALLSGGIDPLSVAVEQAHAVGLSLHAWVNPYRIGTDASRAVTADTFVFSGRYYYIPTADSTHTLVLDGVRELVTGYAIDGIQFDDYFYPSGAVEPHTPAAFETDSYTAYCQAGGALTVAEWRRAAVDRLVSAVYAVCHSREGCVFGISPAADITAVRESMYADVTRWAGTAGYVDYLCPQLYFGFRHQRAPFTAQLDAWSALPRHESLQLIAGLALYKTGLPEDTYAGSGKAEWAQGGDILARQVRAAEAAGWNGTALYSHLSFAADGERDAAVAQREAFNVCTAWKEQIKK